MVDIPQIAQIVEAPSRKSIADGAPQVAYEHKGWLEYNQAALEVDLNSYQHSYSPPICNDKDLIYEENTQPRLIFGLRRGVWIIAIIGIMVIGAAVGVGVGAGLTAQAKKSTIVALPLQSTTPQTTTSPGNSSPSAPSASPSASYTTSSVLPSSSVLFSPPIATAIASIDISCPPNKIVTSYNGQKFFKCESSTGYGGVDIASLVAYSIQDCVEACISTNRIPDSEGQTHGCTTVGIVSNLKGSQAEHGGNCWLKTNTTTKSNSGMATSLKLCKSSDCLETFAP